MDEEKINEKDKQIGLYLKKLREDNDMSQEELAEKLNVSRHSISKWELGTPITKSCLNDVANFFNVPVSFLENTSKMEVSISKKIKKFLIQHYRKIVIICFILLVTICAFLLSCVVYNYNSIKFYDVYVDENKYFSIEDGYFFVSNDELLLYIKPTYKLSQDNISSIKLFYYSDSNSKEKKYILNSTSINRLKIYDWNGYNAYFDFKNLDYTINNLYLEINFVDESSINKKINFSLVFANNYLFSRKREAINDEKLKKK